MNQKTIGHWHTSNFCDVEVTARRKASTTLCSEAYDHSPQHWQHHCLLAHLPKMKASIFSGVSFWLARHDQLHSEGQAKSVALLGCEYSSLGWEHRSHMACTDKYQHTSPSATISGSDNVSKFACLGLKVWVSLTCPDRRLRWNTWDTYPDSFTRGAENTCESDWSDEWKSGYTRLWLREIGPQRIPE